MAKPKTAPVFDTPETTVGARVQFCGHEGWFIADIRRIEGAAIVHAGGPVSPESINRDTMDRLHDVARLLVASLVLAKKDAGERQRIPTSHGVLDRAIQNTLPQFPDWAREQIHLSDSRVGLRCVELPEILAWAQAAELITAPNPYYREAELNASPHVATVLLRRLGVSADEAIRLGEEILREIEQVTMACRSGEGSGIFPRIEGG
jgi:hypothetical protein